MTTTAKNSDKTSETIDKKEQKPVVSTSPEDLSDDDKNLKEELELCVTRLTDTSLEIRLASLKILKDRIRTATSSLTSVPKPLKMLRPHWKTIVDAFEANTSDKSSKHASWFLQDGFLEMTRKRPRRCEITLFD